MKITAMERTAKTKLFKFVKGDNAVLIMVRHVSTVPENQAGHLEHNGTIYKLWGEHGSFLKLVNKCLGSNFRDDHGDRKHFLDNLYKENFDVIIKLDRN
ncbi:hypothetical protein [Paenibacillus sp. B-A-8]|uniref:hypothetical protein n=1 Tax=Paenibacillus sp. B-A-8 TaxID=3400419 RepID=UPI003B025697